jgi:ribose 5-phosphate isomerase A
MTAKSQSQAQPKLGLQWCRPITNIEVKSKIAEQVASRVQEGELVGIGSGSTSFLTVLALGQRLTHEKLRITIVPTSIEIELACQAVGLTVCSDVPGQIDRCFDGADEVDPTGRLIKGRGGALYREKLVFAASRLRLIVADPSKDVVRLGCNFPVPVEVKPQWLRYAYQYLQAMDRVSSVEMRSGSGKDGPVITEAGNVLLDVKMDEITAEDVHELDSIPGVVCTGIFSGYSYERIAD